jgi:hypothetical protein
MEPPAWGCHPPFAGDSAKPKRDFLRHPQHDYQPRLDCLYHPGRHLVSGVPVAGTDSAAAIQVAVPAPLVAHHSSITRAGMLVSSSRRQTGACRPGAPNIADAKRFRLEDVVRISPYVRLTAAPLG